MKIREPTKPRVAKAVSRIALSSLRVGTRLFNPLTLALAGSRRLPLFAVVHHRGRRSGRSYTTPVGARRTADGFVIPLTFGDRADWFRNVRAAGAGVIPWRGADYPGVGPEPADLATARPAFSSGKHVL